MLEYCDPPSGVAEWSERQDSWTDPHSAELRARRALEEVLSVARARVQPNVVQLGDRFKEHAAKWELETAHLSSPTQMMRHPSYEAIILMGNAVVPLLIRDLQENRRAWFGALTYLTGENPIAPSDAGKMDRMIQAWVSWGKEKGCI
jgi:hypothetical protein